MNKKQLGTGVLPVFLWTRQREGKDWGTRFHAGRIGIGRADGTETVPPRTTGRRMMARYADRASVPPLPTDPVWSGAPIRRTCPRPFRADLVLPSPKAKARRQRETVLCPSRRLPAATARQALRARAPRPAPRPRPARPGRCPAASVSRRRSPVLHDWLPLLRLCDCKPLHSAQYHECKKYLDSNIPHIGDLQSH